MATKPPKRKKASKPGAKKKGKQAKKTRKRESYKARVARLVSEGFSPSQARGKPKKGEMPVRIDKQIRVGVARGYWNKKERAKLRPMLIKHLGSFDAADFYIRTLGIDSRMAYVFMHY